MISDDSDRTSASDLANNTSKKVIYRSERKKAWKTNKNIYDLFNFRAYFYHRQDKQKFVVFSLTLHCLFPSYATHNGVKAAKKQCCGHMVVGNMPSSKKNYYFRTASRLTHTNA